MSDNNQAHEQPEEMIAFLGSGSGVPLDLSLLAVSYRKDAMSSIVSEASKVWQKVDREDLGELDRFSALTSISETQEGYNFLVTVAASLKEGWHKDALLELAEFGRKDPLPSEEASEVEYEAWFNRADTLSDKLIESMPASVSLQDKARSLLGMGKR